MRSDKNYVRNLPLKKLVVDDDINISDYSRQSRLTAQCGTTLSTILHFWLLVGLTLVIVASSTAPIRALLTYQACQAEVK